MCACVCEHVCVIKYFLSTRPEVSATSLLSFFFFLQHYRKAAVRHEVRGCICVCAEFQPSPLPPPVRTSSPQAILFFLFLFVWCRSSPAPHVMTNIGANPISLSATKLNPYQKETTNIKATTASESAQQAGQRHSRVPGCGAQGVVYGRSSSSFRHMHTRSRLSVGTQ